MDSRRAYGFCRNALSAARARAAPMNCETMKAGTFPKPMPANVAVKPRAKVTAGFANEVDAVNQYAAAIYAPIANGAAQARLASMERTRKTRPNVATTSLSHCPGLLRTVADACKSGRSNIA